jgi:membrane fusion protein, multidrug efflux system
MRAVWVVAVVVVAGAAVATAVGFGGDGPDPRAATGLPPATAQVTRQTMLDLEEAPGDLGYGRTTTLSGRIAGVITRTPLPGDVIERGRQIYRVDDRPVVLLYGAVAAYRPLTTGTTGTDVRQLEENLRVLGYGGFPVDTAYTSATATAVRRWQKDLGLPQTGEIDLGRVLFAAGAIRVDTVTAGVNESTGGGQEVLRFTGTDRTVTVHLAVSKQRLARTGVQVQVRLPAGRTVPGRVDRVSTVIEQVTGAQDAPPQTLVEVLVSLADPAAAGGIEAAVVLTVPVAALVALAEGGYGLEVVDGTGTRYVKVEPGLFAGGRVEVTGDGLTEGMTVGMPR